MRLCHDGEGASAVPALSDLVSAIRNTPLLVIILFVYFALPQIGIRLGKHESFVFSLAIYAGAYLTEVFRAGLSGVPRGVIDAGRAIGLTGFQLALYVISPIMWRNCLPALGTTFISLFRTSLCRNCHSELTIRRQAEY